MPRPSQVLLAMSLALVQRPVGLAFAEGPDEADVSAPGPLATPPGPDDDGGPPQLETNGRARGAVRGNPVPDNVTDDPLQRTLREFEDGAFPKDGTLPSRQSPPPPARPAVGKEQIPSALRSPETAVTKATPLRPEDARPDLKWLRGLATGDLPIRWDPRVIRYLQFYRDDPRGRAIISAWMRDQARFRSLILDALKRHGLPSDLLYVCMIESSYNPREYSRSGAAGLWQFMPGGGRIYGLKADLWVDERYDPVKSTEAAMLYLKDLHARFGNWPLALAAYNAGYGAVAKSIAKYNTNDFWALLELEGGLPWESSIYVPKAMATAIVGRNPAVFGLAAIPGATPFEYDRVTVDKSATTAVLAAAAGVDAQTIAALNPELLRGRTPPGVPYAVRIPNGRATTFARAFPQLRGDWDGYDAYLVRYGERVEDIARTYGLAPAKLLQLNGLGDGTLVHGGTLIVVPRLDADSLSRNKAAADDDLYHSDVVPGGPDDPMLVALVDPALRVAGRRRVFYRVVAGDTLDTVAGSFGLRPTDLAAWNGIDRDALLQPRMVLAVHVAPTFDADRAHVALLDETRLRIVASGSTEHLDLVEARKGRVRLKVVAKRGDTLESIGRRYGLTKYDVARINRRSYNTPLAKGEEIVVYSVVDRAKARKAGVLAAERPRGKAKPTAKLGRTHGPRGAKPAAAAPRRKKK